MLHGSVVVFSAWVLNASIKNIGSNKITINTAVNVFFIFAYSFVSEYCISFD